MIRNNFFYSNIFLVAITSLVEEKFFYINNFLVAITSLIEATSFIATTFLVAITSLILTVSFKHLYKKPPSLIATTNYFIQFLFGIFSPRKTTRRITWGISWPVIIKWLWFQVHVEEVPPIDLFPWQGQESETD